MLRSIRGPALRPQSRGDAHGSKLGRVQAVAPRCAAQRLCLRAGGNSEACIPRAGKHLLAGQARAGRRGPKQPLVWRQGRAVQVSEPLTWVCCQQLRQPLQRVPAHALAVVAALPKHLLRGRVAVRPATLRSGQVAPDFAGPPARRPPLRALARHAPRCRAQQAGLAFSVRLRVVTACPSRSAATDCSPREMVRDLKLVSV